MATGLDRGNNVLKKKSRDQLSVHCCIIQQLKPSSPRSSKIGSLLAYGNVGLDCVRHVRQRAEQTQTDLKGNIQAEQKMTHATVCSLCTINKRAKPFRFVRHASLAFEY